MDSSIPAPAQRLLDLIGNTEAPKGYDTIYGNHQGSLPKPITSLKVNEVMVQQRVWATKYKSSACGRYQFIRGTLAGLVKSEKLTGEEYFTPNMQDRLGFALVRQCGYDRFITLGDTEQFALRLAQMWASFPVLGPVKGATRQLARGQSYYAGDGLNKALISPDTVEKTIAAMRGETAPAAPAVKPVEVSMAKVEQHSNIITDLIAKVTTAAVTSVGANGAGAIIGAVTSALTHPEVQAAADKADAAINSMPATKSAASSVTIWGALGSIAGTLALAYSAWNSGDRNIQTYWPAIVALGGAATAIYGRFTAKTQIGTP